MTTRNELTVKATDNSGISRVDFYVGDNMIGSTQYKISAKVYDTHGNMTNTNTATVNVPEGLYPIDVTALVIKL
jgi:hypothetical protein